MRSPSWSWTSLLWKLGLVGRRSPRKKLVRHAPLRTETLEIRVPVSDAAFTAALSAAVMGPAACASAANDAPSAYVGAYDPSGPAAARVAERPLLPPAENAEPLDAGRGDAPRAKRRAADDTNDADAALWTALLAAQAAGAHVGASVETSVGVGLPELPENGAMAGGGPSVGTTGGADRDSVSTPSAGWQPAPRETGGGSAEAARPAVELPSRSAPAGADAADLPLAAPPPSQSAAAGQPSGSAASVVAASDVASASADSAAVIAGPTVGIGEATAVEGDDLLFTVRLSAPSATPVSVNYQTAVATAVQDDFASARGTLVFAAGETARQITVHTTADTLQEGDEHLWLVLSKPQGATIADGLGTGGILDNDRPPTINLSNLLDGSGGDGRFLVSLSNPYEQTVSVDYVLSTAACGAGVSPAAAATQVAGTLTFAPGETLASVPVSASFDAATAAGSLPSRGAADSSDWSAGSAAVGRLPAAKHVTLALSGATNATIARGESSGRLTADPQPARQAAAASPRAGDDMMLMSGGSPTLSVAGDTATEGGCLTFAVTVSDIDPSASVVVYYYTADGSATSNDYAGASGTLTFTAEDSVQYLYLSAFTDGLYEGDESFSLALYGEEVGSTSANGYIVDVDSPPTVNIEGASAAEGMDSTAVFLVTLSSPCSAGPNVYYATRDGSATCEGTPTLAADYSAASGDLYFGQESYQWIYVSIANDTHSEPAAEEFYVDLSVSYGGAPATPTATGTGTIYDNDGEPLVTIDPASCREDAGQMTFTLRLGNASQSPAEVTWETTDMDSSPGIGLATPGDDYTPTSSGTAVFQPGETQTTVTVPILDDGFCEPDEGFAIRTTGTSGCAVDPNGASSSGQLTAVGIIEDDDASVDLAIDSNNDGTIDATLDGSDDAIEDTAGDATKPGAVLVVNSGDIDGDRIPDFADGYDLDGIADNADDTPPPASAGQVFVPVDITLDNVDFEVAKLRIEYAASDPAGVTVQGQEPLLSYAPAAGSLRLWTNAGDATRDGRAFNAATPGDYVPANDPNNAADFYGPADLARLGFDAVHRTRRFYVEAVQRSESVAAERIAIKLAPAGDTNAPLVSDAVRLTNIKVQLDVDTNRDGAVDDNDELGKNVSLANRGALILNNCDCDDPVVPLDPNEPPPVQRRDNEDEDVNGPDDREDLAPLLLRRLLSLPDGWSVVLKTRSGDEHFIRVFEDDFPSPLATNVVLGGGDVTPPNAYSIPMPRDGSDFDLTHNDLTYFMEGLQYACQTSETFSGLLGMTVEVRDRAGSVRGSDAVQVRVAPFVMLGHDVKTEQVYVSDEDDDMVSALRSAWSSVTTYTGPDRWAQDQMEIGYSAMPGAAGAVAMHAMMNGPRRRALSAYVPTLCAPDVGYFRGPGRVAVLDEDEVSGDFGGNIEVTPAMPDAGYPLGLVYIGSADLLAPNNPDYGMLTFFAAQGVQTRNVVGAVSDVASNDLICSDMQGQSFNWTDNQWSSRAATTVTIIAGRGAGQIRRVTGNYATAVMVAAAWDVQPDETSLFQLSSILVPDSSWLSVGHIDEEISFLPDGTLVAADPALGMKLLCDQLAKRSSGQVSVANITTNRDLVVEHGSQVIWRENEWQGGYIYITGGKGEGQIRRVAENSDAGYVQVDRPWDPGQVPDSSSTYRIYAISESGVCTTDSAAVDGIEGNTLLSPGDWEGGFIRITSGALAGQVRQIASNTAYGATVTRDWDAQESSGAATGGTATTLIDDEARWNTLGNGGWASGTVVIVAGTGAGQTRDIVSNEERTLTVSTPWTTIPDATSDYLLRIDHPNQSSEFELTNRDAYRAMFFTGEEDVGVCSSATPSHDSLVDGTKNWAANQWVGGQVVILYADGTVATEGIAASDATELEFFSPLTRAVTAADRYVVVHATLQYSATLPALVTVWQILNEGMHVSFPGGEPSAIATESQLIHNIIWGEGGVVATMKEALGSIDVMCVPALYAGEINAPSGGNPETVVRADAFVPGMVNFLSTLDACGNAQVIMPDPFGPSKSLNGAVDDVFADYVDGVLQAGHTLTQGFYLDDWNVYHRSQGETHCGTNSRRAIPDTPWWEV